MTRVHPADNSELASYAKRFHSERRLGLVGDAFSRREVIDRLPGNAAIGHVRYSTTGETILRNVQPLFAELNAGGFAIGQFIVEAIYPVTDGVQYRRSYWRSRLEIARALQHAQGIS